jgi:uncharacterized protein (DUF4415 family)
MKSKKTKTKKKITYGTVEIPDEAFESKNIKERVNCFIDHDVVNWLRQEASKLGIGYQTLLNMKLREAKEGSAEDRIRAIVREELKNKGA